MRRGFASERKFLFERFKLNAEDCDTTDDRLLGLRTIVRASKFAGMNFNKVLSPPDPNPPIVAGQKTTVRYPGALWALRGFPAKRYGFEGFLIKP